MTTTTPDLAAAITPGEIRRTALSALADIAELFPDTLAGLELELTYHGRLRVFVNGDKAIEDAVPGVVEQLGLTEGPASSIRPGRLLRTWKGTIRYEGQEFPAELLAGMDAVLHTGSVCGCGDVHTNGVNEAGQPL